MIRLTQYLQLLIKPATSHGIIARDSSKLKCVENHRPNPHDPGFKKNVKSRRVEEKYSCTTTLHRHLKIGNQLKKIEEPMVISAEEEFIPVHRILAIGAIGD